MADMQNPLLFALPPLIAMAAPAQQADISMEEAIARLISYGLINETPANERDDSVEILHHFAKLKNGDEEIGEFPYCTRLIQLGSAENKVPVSCIRPFVLAGAAVQGENGDTSPLQAAAEEGNVKAVAYLLEAGANLHYQDGDRKMALDYAVENEERAVVFLLLQKGAIATPASMERAAAGDIGILKEMLRYGGIVTADCLCRACHEPENFELLVRSGGDVAGRCRDGLTVAQAFFKRISMGDLPPGDGLAHILDVMEQHDADFYLTPEQRRDWGAMPFFRGSAQLRERLKKLYSQPEPRSAVDEAEEAEEAEDGAEGEGRVGGETEPRENAIFASAEA